MAVTAESRLGFVSFLDLGVREQSALVARSLRAHYLSARNLQLLQQSCIQEVLDHVDLLLSLLSMVLVSDLSNMRLEPLCFEIVQRFLF